MFGSSSMFMLLKVVGLFVHIAMHSGHAFRSVVAPIQAHLRLRNSNHTLFFFSHLDD